MPSSRRTLLGTLLTGALAGCVDRQQVDPSSDSNATPEDSDEEGVSDTNNERSVDSDGDGVPDTNDDFPENSTYTYLVTSESEILRLRPSTYKLYGFEVNAVSDLVYDIQSEDGIPVDIIVTDKTNFEKFKQGSNWNYYKNGSQLDTTRASITFTVGTKRHYYLIIDNSQRGRAAPATRTAEHTVVVDVNLELRRRS